MAVTRSVVILAASMALIAAAVVKAQDAQVVESRYKRTCAVCHAAGAAGAPRSGDVAAWQPRLDKGMDVLVASVENGLKAMPPKGMCFDCTAQDYEALIWFMARPRQ